MAQSKTINQAGATLTIDETALGYAPKNYAAHTLGLHDAGAGTATVYAYPLGGGTLKSDIVTLENQDAITIPVDSGPWEKFEISFSLAGGSAKIHVNSKISASSA